MVSMLTLFLMNFGLRSLTSHRHALHPDSAGVGPCPFLSLDPIPFLNGVSNLKKKIRPFHSWKAYLHLGLAPFRGPSPLRQALNISVVHEYLGN